VQAGRRVPLPYAAVFPHTAGIRARGRPVIQATSGLVRGGEPRRRPVRRCARIGSASPFIDKEKFVE